VLAQLHASGTRIRGWTKALLAFRIHFGDRLPTNACRKVGPPRRWPGARYLTLGRMINPPPNCGHSGERWPSTQPAPQQATFEVAQRPFVCRMCDARIASPTRPPGRTRRFPCACSRPADRSAAFFSCTAAQSASTWAVPLLTHLRRPPLIAPRPAGFGSATRLTTPADRCASTRLHSSRRCSMRSTLDTGPRSSATSTGSACGPLCLSVQMRLSGHPPALRLAGSSLPTPAPA